MIRRNPARASILIAFAVIVVMMFGMPVLTEVEYEGIVGSIMQYMPLILILVLFLGAILIYRRY